jgi:hypothetical protein
MPTFLFPARILCALFKLAYYPKRKEIALIL